MKVTPHGRG
ncbi:hypothetical protein GCK32_022650, partial [Trichostrongylus colubriformis]